MDQEAIILSQVRQKNKYHMIPLKCGIQNVTQMNLFTKQKDSEYELIIEVVGGSSGKDRGKG